MFFVLKSTDAAHQSRDHGLIEAETLEEAARILGCEIHPVDPAGSALRCWDLPLILKSDLERGHPSDFYLLEVPLLTARPEEVILTPKDFQPRCSFHIEKFKIEKWGHRG